MFLILPDLISQILEQYFYFILKLKIDNLDNKTSKIEFLI
jgi:hypothetical protein